MELAPLGIGAVAKRLVECNRVLYMELAPFGTEAPAFSLVACNCVL